MLGSAIAGCKETPGEYQFLDGIRVKKFRGMGSIGAIGKSREVSESSGSMARYNIDSQAPVVAQGVSATVADKGSIRNLIPMIMQGVKHGMQNMGMYSIPQLHKGLVEGTVRMQIRSGAAIAEGNISKTLISYNVQ
ncbi:bifunctional Aldolase-type TIM barrel/Inosine-5'-monophosphate dehydrogenase/IMP dehydrogenase-GMP reductase [Babesia duncani]|uniref:Bifunctional Aldolase-type TIM barrel/Inosine-5'-monophosphate dehydrogenase/IMP dehydrogenase-GMP reductase n=1 Tax=Babesia duncani TaxID=323732 RepID=A0AAD9UMV6_9APIC|nr:bifunctional Aldolase-type TIM barrel/Inosine-5'-monophosphate dehydrogenase/IMP dehydrogenase-GMP reductase [Babesia duncani]